MMALFVLGLILGGSFGVFVAALCVAAREGDRAMAAQPETEPHVFDIDEYHRLRGRRQSL